MSAVYKREMRSYFNGMTGYAFCAFLMFVTGILSVYLNFFGNNTSFAGILPSVLSVCAIAIPVLTMRTAAEEKSQKTDILLYSLPVPMRGIIAAKYAAALSVFAIPCVLMCLFPLALSAFGAVHFGNEFSCILAFFLAGAVFIAIGVFVSSLTDNPVSAAFLSMAALLTICLIPRITAFIPEQPYISLILFAALAVGAGFLVWKLTRNNAAGLFSGALLIIATLAAYAIKPELFRWGFAKFLNSLSVYGRFDSFIYGIFDLRTVLYFLSLIFLFLFFAVQAMEKKRWS